MPPLKWGGCLGGLGGGPGGRGRGRRGGLHERYPRPREGGCCGKRGRPAGRPAGRRPALGPQWLGANGGPLVGQGGAPKGTRGGLGGRPPSLLPPPRGCTRTGPGGPPSKPGPSQSPRCRTCRRCWSQSSRSPCRRPRPTGEYGRLNGRGRPPSAGRQKPGGGR